MDCNKQQWFVNSKVKWVLKLVEIGIILMFRFVKDEYTFSTFAFLKDKLWNWLKWHLDTNVHMFAHEFLIQDNFPHHDVITLLKDEKMQVGATI